MLIKQNVFRLFLTVVSLGTLPNLFCIRLCAIDLNKQIGATLDDYVRSQREPPLLHDLNLSDAVITTNSLVINMIEDGFHKVASQHTLHQELKNDSIAQQKKSCEGYVGILLIAHVLPQAGAGTVFFQSIMSSLLFAERYNLYPWIHINSSFNKFVYDPKVHGEATATSTTSNPTFSHMTGTIPNVVGKRRMKCQTKLGIRPGAPDHSHFELQNYTLVGNGIWASYFEPPLPIPILDKGPCSSLPIFKLSYRQATVGMVKCSNLAVRAWPYRGTPLALMPQPGQSIQSWLWEHRKRAASVVQQYYRPHAWLKQRVEQANPVRDQKCLSMHVRLTDKANGRDKKSVEAYLPYALVFARMTRFKFPIYLATDDATVVSKIRKELYPAVVIMQENVVRSDSDTPTFELLQNDTHRSNSETLIEIYSLAKCSYFVHGYSGMSEAVVYISPHLHRRSINVDDPQRKTLKEFRRLLLREKNQWRANELPSIIGNLSDSNILSI